MCISDCARLTVGVKDDDQQSGLYEPLLRENEREAVASLLQFLEHVRRNAARE